MGVAPKVVTSNIPIEPLRSRVLAPHRHFVGAAAAFVLLATASRLAYFRMFAQFVAYDDEGYIFQTIRAYLSGARLYDEAFSQYGPAFYLFARVLHGCMRLPITHDAVRLLTIAYWVAATTLSGAIVFRLTRSALLSGVCALLAFGYLTPLINEPGHPQGILIVIVLLACFVAAGAGPSARTRAGVCGALTALAVLIKINVGTYLGLGLLVPLVLASPLPALVRAATVVTAGVMPFVILKPHLHTFGGPYAVLVSMAVLSIATTAMPRLRGVLPDRQPLAAFCSGAIVIAAAVVAATLLDGTSVAALVRAVLIEPQRLRSIFVIDPNLPVWTAPAAFVSAALSVAFLVERVRRSAFVHWLILPVRVAGGWALVAGLNYGTIISALTPTLWLASVRPVAIDLNAALLARTSIASVAALQTLMAYPVAGSQLAFASVVTLILTVAALDDVVNLVARDARARALVRVACAVLALYFMRPYIGFRSTAAHYHAGYELRLPGASRLRLPPEQVARLHWVTATVSASCDGLVSIPGLFSLNAWTGIAPPTFANVGAWQILLSPEQQGRIWAALDRAARPCVVVNPALAAGWFGGPLDGEGRLRARRTIASADGFSVMTSDYAESVVPVELVAGRQAFSANRTPLPLSAAFMDERNAATIRLWFRTSAPGVLLGCAFMPKIYIGSSGTLRTSGGGAAPSNVRVTDAAWHHVVVSRDPRTERFYIDGRLVSVSAAGPPSPSPGACQIGGGLTTGWTDARDGWMALTGDVDSVGVTPTSWDDRAVERDWQSGRGRHQER